ncbi:hypothetical protein BDZ91DRAFT_744181 [Kalaharituber pfeilii]|nr:hypothetical protein BDZ91DRAFT_744181 [Kalaharituber pfeilii]
MFLPSTARTMKCNFRRCRPPFPITRALSSSLSFSHSASPRKETEKHNDIPSFKEYAVSVGLDPMTTVYRGTLYEYIVSRALFEKNMVLIRSGGRDDRGIDLHGYWHIPQPTLFPNNTLPIIPLPSTTPSADPDLSSPILSPTLPSPSSIRLNKPLPVLIQCKGLSNAAPGPNIIRELSGTMANHPPSTIGILASLSPCTPGARSAMRLSRRAMAYVCVSRRGIVRQFLWNQVAANLLGGGMQVGLRYISKAKPEGLAEQVRIKKEEDKKGKRKRRSRKEKLREKIDELDRKAQEEAKDDDLEKEAVLLWHGTVIDGMLTRQLRREIKNTKA